MAEHVNIPCTSCGAVNRAEVSRLGRGPVCSRCKAGLAPDRPRDVNADQFDRAALGSDLPVLVDFWAPWCGPCQSMHPVLEQLAREFAGRAMALKLNTDLHPEIAARYGIRGVPTFIVFRDGVEAGRQTGAVPKEVLAGLLAG